MMRFVAWVIASQSLAALGAHGKTLVRREAKVNHIEEEDHVTPDIKAGKALLHRETGLKHIEEEEDHVTHSVKALFRLSDVDRDGKITVAEFAKLKETLGQSRIHMPALMALLELHRERGTGISFAEFNKEAHQRTSNVVAHQITKHDTVHQHQHFVANGSMTDSVSCGGHRAKNCEACTTTDSTGQTVADHYAEWCHGDCVFNPADSKCHKKGTVTISGTHTLNSQHTTTAAPDLLNPNFTKEDEEFVEAGAKAAIREEKLEEEEKNKEKKKFVGSVPFWFLIAASACCFICICCVSTCVVAVVLAGDKPGNKLEDSDGEPDAGTDAGTDGEPDSQTDGDA